MSGKFNDEFGGNNTCMTMGVVAPTPAPHPPEGGWMLRKALEAAQRRDEGQVTQAQRTPFPSFHPDLHVTVTSVRTGDPEKAYLAVTVEWSANIPGIRVGTESIRIASPAIFDDILQAANKAAVAVLAQVREQLQRQVEQGDAAKRALATLVTP